MAKKQLKKHFRGQPLILGVLWGHHFGTRGPVGYLWGTFEVPGVPLRFLFGTFWTPFGIQKDTH